MKKINGKDYIVIDCPRDFWRAIDGFNYTEEYTKDGLLLEVENNNNYFVDKDFIHVIYDNNGCMIWLFDDYEYCGYYDLKVSNDLKEKEYM